MHFKIYEQSFWTEIKNKDTIHPHLVAGFGSGQYASNSEENLYNQQKSNSYLT